MTILTIDFDFIMEPIIQQYNSFINPNIDRYCLWHDVYQKLPDLSNNLTFSIDNYKYICDIFDNIDTDRNIYIGQQHSNVITAMYDMGLLDGRKFDIVNIDHHHDIYYTIHQKEIIDKHDDFDCANWVYYLLKNKVVSSYTWINNTNSETHEFKEMQSIFNFYKKDQYHLDLSKVDFIFFTPSLSWIPREYDYLYINLLNRIYKRFNNDNIYYYYNSDMFNYINDFSHA